LDSDLSGFCFVLDPVPGADVNHTYTFKSDKYSSANGFGDYCWYLDAHKRQKVRFVRVDEDTEIENTAKDDGKQTSDSAAVQKRERFAAMRRASLAPSSAALNALDEMRQGGFLSAGEFEVKRLECLRDEGVISKKVFERRMGELAGGHSLKHKSGMLAHSYFRWDWFRLRQYFISLVVHHHPSKKHQNC
jgi:hypothetical protein